MQKILFLAVFFLSACGGTENVREVSRHTDGAHPQGMSYQQFRNHNVNADSDSLTVQKRFMSLDRDNNGVLSGSEFSGY